jgi:hypothetical protein
MLLYPYHFALVDADDVAASAFDVIPFPDGVVLLYSILPAMPQSALADLEVLENFSFTLGAAYRYHILSAQFRSGLVPLQP